MKNTNALDAITLMDENQKGDTELHPGSALDRERVAATQYFPLSIEDYIDIPFERIENTQPSDFGDATIYNKQAKESFISTDSRLSSLSSESERNVESEKNVVPRFSSNSSISMDGSDYIKESRLLSPYKEYPQLAPTPLLYNEVPMVQVTTENNPQQSIFVEQQRQLPQVNTSPNTALVMPHEEFDYVPISKNSSMIGSNTDYNTLKSSFFPQEDEIANKYTSDRDKESFSPFLSQIQNTNPLFEDTEQSSNTDALEQQIHLMTTIEIDGQVLGEFFERYISNQSLRT